MNGVLNMNGFRILNGMQLFGRAFRATRREIWVSLKGAGYCDIVVCFGNVYS